MIVNDGKDNLASLIAANYTKVRIGDGSDGTAASQDGTSHIQGLNCLQVVQRSWVCSMVVVSC